MGKYQTQIRKRLMYHLHIHGWHKSPRPSWYYPTDSLVTDPEEIIKAIRLDDEIGVKKRG
jgi:hypothetical protein